ncbi:hypothetical protein AWB77_02977 [Caballeronia fortuita]|uniref:Uncharacterized protein n=1 Tax=Caballeronia fortuita TaxID=1777138 RepID=A0A158BLX6_9BURK|nr:hypothetical protein [Caballeronia fortuita]SAK71054.1 hypothetical protein AWB77_02977 [Caballeronia fortuita]
MSEPLIVVEGNLRLPTLRALPDPSLNYGFRWSPARSRPVQSPSEFALLAARFATAYVPALGLSDLDSPYRAASLWAVFAKEEIPRAMLRIDDAHASDDADEARAEPIPLSVAEPAGARTLRFSKPVATAVAAACGMLIVWLLLGRESASQHETRVAPAGQAAMPMQPSEPPPATTTTTALTPGDAPAPDRSASVEPLLPAPTTPPTDAMEIATANDAAAKGIEAVRAAPVVQAAVMPVESAESAKPAEPAKLAKSAASAKSAKRSIAVAADRRHNGHIEAVAQPHAKPVLQRARPANERVAIREHREKREIGSRRNATPIDRAASRLTSPLPSMDPTTLYSMLQHSPTLDSNAASSGRGATKSAR